MNKKSILDILVLHQSFLEHKISKEAYEVIREEAQKINEDDAFNEVLEIKVHDWEQFQPDSGIVQNLEKIRQDADKANAVFILADGCISRDTLKWYESAMSDILKENDPENQVRIPIFWDVSKNEYKKKFEEFCNRGNRIDYERQDRYYQFDSVEDKAGSNAPLRPIVAKILKQLAKKWAVTIYRNESVPTLETIRKKREIEEQERRKRRIRRLLVSAFLVTILGLFMYYFLYPAIKLAKDKKSFGHRVSNVEALISEGQYDPARDSLNILDTACNPQWQDLKEQIKKLKESFPTTPSPDPEPIHEPKLNLPSTAHTHQIIKNGCVIISDNQDLESILRKNLGNADLSLVFPEKGIPEWKIEIRETVDSTIFTDEDVKFYRAQVTIFADIKKGNAIETLSAKKICNGQLSHTSSTNTAREKAADDISEQIVEYLKQHK